VFVPAEDVESTSSAALRTAKIILLTPLGAGSVAKNQGTRTTAP
jgi:hypothetical protein